MSKTVTSRAALLIIDMISAFDFPEAQMLAPSVRSAARQIHRLREAFHQRGLPVIYANDNFANWKSDFRELVAMAEASCALGAMVVDQLRPGADDYFVLKPKHSAFLATAMPLLLAKLGVDTVYLSGMTADSCVLATAADANAREYRVRVVREAVAGTTKGKSSGLTAIQASKIGVVVSVASVVKELGMGP